MFPTPSEPDFPYLVLQRDDWNDYSYYTFFEAFLILTSQVTGRVKLGGVRVMRKGQAKGETTFPKDVGGPIDSEELVGNYCSLSGQKKYYIFLQELGDLSLARRVLSALQDASWLPEVRRSFQAEPCFKISLLRESSDRMMLDEAGLMFGGTNQMIDKFVVEIKLQGASGPHVFDFDFDSAQSPLSKRVHALVGLNGVGKTQVLARLAMLMSRFSQQAEKERTSVLDREDILDPVPSIYNVVAISFSAFDEFDRPTEKQGERFSYSYCGLRTQRGKLRTEEELLAEIKDLISTRMDDEQREILVTVLDSIVRVEDIHAFVFQVEAHAQIYGRLSAGQRITLNCLCHLLSKIRPRTLVLFDEPELHLHPQLLANLMSALADILERFESFAIVATHSPIVIQELPRTCVHVVRRERMMPVVYHPTFETFGENLSEITRNVFVATDSDRDYRAVLQRLLQQSDNQIEIVSEMFQGKLGLNAMIFLQSLVDNASESQ